MASRLEIDQMKAAEWAEERWGQVRAGTSLPEGGTTWADIESEMDGASLRDVDADHANMSLLSFRASSELQEVAKRAWARYSAENAVFAGVTPSLLDMENELLHWCVGLLGGGESGRAFFTSGGTESVLHGLKSARDWARESHPRVVKPEVVAPTTAHPCVNKVCQVLGLSLIRVPVGGDQRADEAAMERRITRNTIAMLASAPCWPFGRFDDIAGLAAVAERHGVWFHCDAAVGGYIAPFVRDLGRPIPEFDLSVPGVCSLSADLHKYGFSPKPASTILYASPEWARFQPFYFDDWAFGAFMTPSLAGSRPAGAVAAAWAVMRFLGKDGYREMAQRLMWVKDALTDGINRIRGLRAWDTDLTLLLYGAEGISIRAVAQGMKRLGYFVMGSRDADADLIHLTLDVADKLWIQTYLSDLEKVVHGVWNGDVRSGDADDARRYV